VGIQEIEYSVRAIVCQPDRRTHNAFTHGRRRGDEWTVRLMRILLSRKFAAAFCFDNDSC
jgi:hypothetical protein